MQKIDIINLALVRIGQASIASLTEASEEATKASAVWQSALDTTLQAFRWGFNTKRSTLALLATSPAGYEYQYKYSLPTGFLQAYAVYETDSDMQPYDFIVEDGALFTDCPEAVLVYAVRTESTALFSSAFVDALAWRLAGDLALCLAQRNDYARQAEQQYQQAISTARALAGNNKKTAVRSRSRYITARG